MPSHHSRPPACSPFLCWWKRGRDETTKTSTTTTRDVWSPAPFTFHPKDCNTPPTPGRFHHPQGTLKTWSPQKARPPPNSHQEEGWIVGGGSTVEREGLAWLQWEQMRAHLLPWQLPPTRKARSVGWLKNTNQHLNEGIKGSWCRGGRWDQHFTNYVSQPHHYWKTSLFFKCEQNH